MQRFSLGLFVATSLAPALSAQSGTTQVSFTLGQGSLPGSGAGIPGYVAGHVDPGSLVFSANAKQLPYSTFGYQGLLSATEIIIVLATTHADVLDFFDGIQPVPLPPPGCPATTGRRPTIITNGRTGVALLKFGTGDFHKATGCITYTITCQLGCFDGKGSPQAASYSVIFSAGGVLNLPGEALSDAIPTTTPAPLPPPPAGGGEAFHPLISEDRVKSALHLPAAPAGFDMSRPAQPEITGAAATDGAYFVSPPMAFVDSTYSTAASCPNLSTCWLNVPQPSAAIAAFDTGQVEVDLNTSGFSAGVTRRT